MAIEKFKLNSLDYSNVTIGNSKFNDDIWDLSPIIMVKHLKSQDKIINFTYIKSNNIKLIVKLYAYYKLGVIKPSTVINKININLRAFIKFCEINNISEFSQLTKEMYFSYISWLKNDYIIINNKNRGAQLSESTKYFYLQILEDIIKLGQTKGWNVPIFKINNLNSSLFFNPLKKASLNKTKSIPENIFDKIINCSIYKEKDPITRSAIIIQSQTGLRASEVLSIKQGCVNQTSEGNSYIEVMISKTTKGEPIKHKVFCNDLVVDTVKLLEKATQSIRKMSGLEELFIFKHKGKVSVFNVDLLNLRLKKFVGKWDIKDDDGKLYSLHSHQFRATFVRELIKQNVPIFHIMKHFNHVSIEMTSHYLTLKEEEIKEIYSDMILGKDSKIAGLRAREIKSKLDEQFRGKTEQEVDNIISNLSKSMSFNPLPTGVCLYDFRRGNCSDGDGCFFYNCPNYVTEVKFYPILKQELDLMEKEMTRYKELGQQRSWERQYVKYKYLKPLVDSLEEQINEEK